MYLLLGRVIQSLLTYFRRGRGFPHVLFSDCVSSLLAGFWLQCRILMSLGIHASEYLAQGYYIWSIHRCYIYIYESIAPEPRRELEPTDCESDAKTGLVQVTEWNAVQVLVFFYAVKTSNTRLLCPSKQDCHF